LRDLRDLQALGSEIVRRFFGMSEQQQPPQHCIRSAGG
jgi:hypothetical protein